jgi:hypothetical protein
LLTRSLLLTRELGGIGSEVLLILDDLREVLQFLLGLIALRLGLLEILHRLIEVLLRLHQRVVRLLLLLAGLRPVGRLRIERSSRLTHVIAR